MAVVTVHSDFGAQENKICHCFHFPLSICHEMMGLDAMIISVWMLSLQPAFSLSSFTFIKRIFSSSLLSNMLSRLLITFLPRSKHLLISWLQSPSAVILEPKKIKSVTVSIVYPSICHEVMWQHAMIIVFWMLSFKPAFSLSSFTFIKRFFSSSSFSAIRVESSAYLPLLIFLPANFDSSLWFIQSSFLHDVLCPEVK